MCGYLQDSKELLKSAKVFVDMTNNKIAQLPLQIDEILEKYGICKKTLRKETLVQ